MQTLTVWSSHEERSDVVEIRIVGLDRNVTANEVDEQLTTRRLSESCALVPLEKQGGVRKSLGGGESD